MHSNYYINANEYLQCLIDQPLVYGIKSPDTELYDFGFGTKKWEGGWEKDLPTYCLHSICDFDIIWKNDPDPEPYDGNTPHDIFHSRIGNVIGKKVEKIVLSKENDLLLKFENCKIIFYTFQNEEESWRFFACDKNQPHLVVASVGYEFVY